MPSLRIDVDGDGQWIDLKEKNNNGIINGDLEAIAALKGGMESGRASVGFRIELPDGNVVFCQTSMRLFLNAAKLFMIRYGQELEGEA